MRTLKFAGKNQKELFRDPLSLTFGVALPVVLLLLLSMIQRSVEASSGVVITQFQLENFAPGMAVFSLSFLTLFGGLLIATDRRSAFLSRLYASPMTPADFILGYSLPMLPLGLAQGAVCYITGLCLGLDFSWNLLAALVGLIPSILLFTSLGLLFGSLLSDKQVGGIGSVVIQVAALSGGIWFDMAIVGKTMETVCYALPFAHAVDIAKLALAGDFAAALPHLPWVLGYTLLFTLAAILLFRQKMKQ